MDNRTDDGEESSEIFFQLRFSLSRIHVIQISSVKFQRVSNGIVDRSPVEKTIQPMETN